MLLDSGWHWRCSYHSTTSSLSCWSLSRAQVAASAIELKLKMLTRVAFGYAQLGNTGSKRSVDLCPQKCAML